MNPIEIPISGESIRLGQLLKFASVVEDGADARAVIEAGEVEVNGEVDTRRGRQVRAGDTVTYAGETFSVVAES
ncbi:RNA-binding S4 domain-containing protein [Knoellia subterranea]|uniref:tRNA synthetase RNA-binding protein n=1 Tax=Knoellia subterranea KCTC 19937 TaxID=1385521 RepID=A0A0A0JIX2_9MICO|nr:RNA-binding S4 domain-containing protein [Knoellia subterranea]KGN37375.1 tRNA synthetase RNA-binding protein [Knoellia subterranea KCTC 19937]